MTELKGSFTDNARQVVMDGYVCGYEDGENVALHWVATGHAIGSGGLVEALLQLIVDGEVVIGTETVVPGLKRLELVEAEALVDCN